MVSSNDLFDLSECFHAIDEGNQAQLHERYSFGKETSSQTE